jgi:hypothetical protein
MYRRKLTSAGWLDFSLFHLSVNVPETEVLLKLKYSEDILGAQFYSKTLSLQV